MFDGDWGGIARAAKKIAPVTVGAMLVAGTALGADLPDWAIASIEQWGPAVALVIWISWYVPPASIRDFINAQQGQAVAMQRIGDQLAVMSGQSGKLDDILSVLEEVQINQDVMISRLKNLETRATNG